MCKALSFFLQAVHMHSTSRKTRLLPTQTTHRNTVKQIASHASAKEQTLYPLAKAKISAASKLLHGILLINDQVRVSGAFHSLLLRKREFTIHHVPSLQQQNSAFPYTYLHLCRRPRSSGSLCMTTCQLQQAQTRSGRCLTGSELNTYVCWL